MSTMPRSCKKAVYDYVVIGGGVSSLGLIAELVEYRPGASILVVEGAVWNSVAATMLQDVPETMNPTGNDAVASANLRMASTNAAVHAEGPLRHWGPCPADRSLHSADSQPRASSLHMPGNSSSLSTTSR